ncbi:TPA: hypothetical protein HA265_08140 [Candidatus Woesearchaeota archaeon]|nr:hypothetical protein [Candidatus Woesearchaeota archaeon]
MEEELKRKPVHNVGNLEEQRYKEVDSFAKKVLEIYKGKIASVLVMRPRAGPDAGSVEMLLIIDDLKNMVVEQQLAEIKISATDIAYSSSIQIHCETMLASELWEGFKARDKNVTQIMRDALVVKDNGFFLPIQDLLVTGRIRPSRESVDVYFIKAEQSMKAANQHVGKAIVDLYWAVMDTAHASVMVLGITPPSPAHMADTVRKELVLRNLVHRRCGDIVERFFNAAKQVMHRERFEISGREFDSYISDADFFIKEMNDFIEEHAKTQ